MNNRIPVISLQKTARFAGLVYLILFVAGIFAEFFVRSKLIVQGDAAATASNLLASESLFRMGIASDLIMIVCDIALALMFYVLFKPVRHSLSLLAAFFRLIQAAILGINLLNLFFALQLLSGAEYLSVFGADQLEALVLLFLHAHDIGYSIGLVFFGVNLFILGYLFCKSAFVPKILGRLLIVASIGYFVDSLAKVLLSNYEKYAAGFDLVVFTPAVIAELSLLLSLMIKGVNDKRLKANEVTQ